MAHTIQHLFNVPIGRFARQQRGDLQDQRRYIHDSSICLGQPFSHLPGFLRRCRVYSIADVFLCPLEATRIEQVSDKEMTAMGHIISKLGGSTQGLLFRLRSIMSA